MSTSPHALRVEHLDEPLGVGVRRPRLSWRLPEGARSQTAYRITTSPDTASGTDPATGTDTASDTGWVASPEHLLVAWPAPPLASSTRVRWQVAVRTDLGDSPPSAPCRLETGLLDEQDWHASWIEPATVISGEPGGRPAALLRAEFTLARPVVAARLHATAHGLYEAHLNAARVGDAELTPGFTQYDARLQVQTYDVTSLLRQGPNALAVVLADGWFRGQIGITRAAGQWGERLALLVQLHVEHDDGSSSVLGTDGTWRSTTGHVTAADLIAGESWDLRLLPRGWDLPGFDDSTWEAAAPAAHGYGGLVASPSPPVRRVQELRPVSVRRLAPGRHVVDLGQNINGWVRLADLGPAGTRLVLTHGEVLDAAGDVSQDNLRPDLPFLPHPLPAGQVDVVVSAGTGEVFEPRRTTHGFRYVRVEGHPGELTPDAVTGVVVHTDLRRTGEFACSDERLNRLHEAAVWSLRGNVCDIPTDCPHRERAGWTGDWQVYVPTAAFLYDVAGFSTKWLRDVAADQWPDGTVANVSPCARAEGAASPIAFLNGSAGWGDAAVIVPWELYRAYGDVGVLAETWPTMVAWMDRTERIARTQRHPRRAAARPQPADHEQYLWDAGFHWGEWLVPGDDSARDLASFAAADKGEVATAFYARSSDLMARIAALLGRQADAARYAELSERVRRAWRAEYLGDDGSLVPDTQADHVRALAFALVPEHLRPAVADRLATLVRGAGTHLGTGFLATGDLLPVLAESGHLDLAYELLGQDTEPSWLTMIERGATTMWEHWDGVSAAGPGVEPVVRDSLNHYAKGAVVAFLHRCTAGIQLLDDGPAYRRFRVRPRPGGGLTWARAAHESPHGQIESAWRLAGGLMHLRVVVPAGTQAEVVLPDGSVSTVGPGEHSFRSSIPDRLEPTSA